MMEFLVEWKDNLLDRGVAVILITGGTSITLGAIFVMGGALLPTVITAGICYVITIFLLGWIDY